ncbi:hypothetical protein A1O1_08550 [Capronia coronata CBS 617.96]|uniref:Importin N-terminal domain-containing protein n=1 Tax=Capronia coronata CBS 617.96 TaxID=1182541 RepID=W9XTV6_9EURO|nr:uncharacterized protein A1O1_08550 [Capronia coronata CBS 617.96]EXJ80406.1 hypothetical protein A1O1_08550 [Capronia coronata CBS 617.96]
MEELIRELNDPSNQSAPERINEIQRQIQRLQREKTAWQLGLDLLQNEDATLRFYGALTLTIKINADWDNDALGKDEGMRNYLIEALVTNYTRLVDLPDSNFVLRKLSSTLTALFVRADSGWRYPLRQVLACLLSRHYVAAADLPEMGRLLDHAQSCAYQQLKGVLMIAAIMAEDLSSHSQSSVAESKLMSRAAANCSDAWQLFRFCLARMTEKEPAASSHPNELFQLLVQATPYWASLLKSQEATGDSHVPQQSELVVKECIGIISNWFEDASYTACILQMLISLQQSTPKLLRESLPNFPASITASRKAEEMVDRLTQGDFDSDGILYVDLLETIMSQLDLTKSDFLHTGLYDTIIRTLQRLLRCEGVAVIEDPVCQIALEKISEIVEGSSDWEEDDQAKTFVKALATDACQACLHKIKLPTEQMSNDTQDWDMDERLKFQDFRYDVQDFLQSAFTVLGSGLIEEIVGLILSQGPSTDWSTFEAATFSLAAFSDTMSSDPNTYDGVITTVLSSQPWTYLLRSGPVVPDRARQTGIRFITENEGYLQRHPDSLVMVLNFLFSSLHLQASASAASRAIYSLCDSHRSILKEGLPQFMGSLATIGDLGEAERHRIYAAVAAIIQALPSDDAKMEPLSQLIASVAQALAVLDEGRLDGEELVKGCIDIMQTLAWIGKGLRSPHDQPVDLEASHPQGQVDFWINGPGAAVQTSILSLYGATLKKMQAHVDSDFIEACCDFIKSGFPEDHPAPFKFADSTALSLISELVHLDNPAIDTTLACASSLLASIAPASVPAAVRKLVYLVCAGLQQTLSTFHESRQLPNTNFASSSLDFLARLVAKWGVVWFGVEDSEGTAAVAFESGLVVLADPDTLPRRSAAAFFAAFADFTVPDALTAFDPEVPVRVGNLLRQFGPRILSLILRLLGGECARSEIDSLTEPLKKFVQKQLMLTKTVLREVVKPESGVMSEKALQATTLEERERFLAQIEALRGGRKTNDIVKDFWIACRGSGFGYIA